MKPQNLPFDPAIYTVIACFSAAYLFLAWLVSGGETWWIVDFIHGMNVFYGDDAYRFFLAKSAWSDSTLYTYNFDLPVALALEGFVVAPREVGVFEARAIHAVIASLSLFLVWSTGIALGLGRSIVLCAVIFMGFMPLYAFVSLSFYGETWLCFFLCMGIFLLVKERWDWLAIVAALFPLIRPEGIFFLIPVLIFFIKRGLFKEATILLTPGGIYFLYLCLTLGSLSDYVFWRAELRRILMKFPYDEDRWKFFFLFTPLISIPALFGLTSKRLLLRIWPFVLGGIIWASFLQVEILIGLTYFEPRYGHILVPVITLLWAAGIKKIFDVLPAIFGFSSARGMVLSASLILGIGGSLYQVDGVKLTIQERGILGFVETVSGGRWGDIFPRYEEKYIKNYREMSDKIVTLAQRDKGIDRVIVFDSFFYYFIDSNKLPNNVRVEYPALGYLVFHMMLNGQVFTQHQGGRMYSYYKLGEPTFSTGENRLIYADAFPMPKYPYRWEKEGVQVYLFSYAESSEPDVKLSSAPILDPKKMQAIYKQVFSWK